MNFSSLLATGASGLALILGLTLFISGWLNTSTQGRWQDQQQELMNHQTEFARLQQDAQLQQQQIQGGQQLQQQGTAVLKEIAAYTLPPKNNEKLKSLLARHQITVQPPATPAAATPGPAVRPSGN